MRAPHPRMLTYALLAAALLGAPVAAQQKPVLAPDDYAQWESLGSTVLSPDGRWLAYTVSRVDGDDELRFREVARDSTRVVKHAARPVFSADNRWLAYSIGVSEAERERMEAAKQPVRSRLGIVDLRSGTTTVVNDVAGFEFSGDGAFIAMRAFPPKERKNKGVDVVIRDLTRGIDTNFGNVSGFSWRADGALLAMTIDAENRAGNGVRLYDPRSGRIETLESDTAEYIDLTWREDAADLAVLRVQPDTAWKEPGHSVIAWRGAGTSKATRAAFDPAVRSGFPEAHRIVELRSLRWSPDGGTLYFGMKEWTPARPGSAARDSVRAAAVSDTAAADSAAAPKPGKKEEPAGVEVWHADDVEIIPEQKVRAGIERNRNFLAAWHLDDDRFVQLASDVTEDVTLSDGRYAIGLDGTPYDEERMFGPVYRDLYMIDATTGERERFVEHVQFQYGPSPSGRYALYVRDGHYWTYDAETRRHTNITKDIATSFINTDNDYTIEEKPPYGSGGWTTDDRSVLLYDEYDIWEVSPDGSRAVNLTQGRADRLVHRRYWLSPDDRVVDMSKPVYVTLYGDRTKQHGYGRLRSKGPAERLVLMERNVGRLAKAEDADVYVYRIEDFDDAPDLFVADADLQDARQVTNMNPFQSKYAWGRSELVDFTSATGNELQAALLYPANYEPGRKYPMIVYFYETTSNTVHSYSVPSETSAYNPAVFTQNGYFVLRPDIVYRGRNPGLSAVEALVPAVEKIVATGMVDRERVGIVGHSWGAYQTAFAVTQTDLFAAAVAGAPLTDLVSMYLSIYWNSGGTDARIFEISQGRMEVPPWEDLEAYMRNSPLFNITQMNTPLLVAFGDKDGAVDWHQGIELYNAARRADKDMVMLVYEGENHSLSKKPNQLDYHRRINQWFDHYLKGAPAPEWMTSGVRHLARERELELIKSGGR